MQKTEGGQTSSLVSWVIIMTSIIKQTAKASINAVIGIMRWPKFLRDFAEFRRLAHTSKTRVAIFWRDRYPCLHDNVASTGFDRHYVYHTAWAARVIKETKPQVHVDISSSLYFSGIVSAFCPIRFYDIRPAHIVLPNLESGAADLQRLPFDDGSIKSLSCMHVIEHIGLGRYGDALDPDGDLKAISELKRVLAPGANFLFVAPIGRPRIAFNAHRIYAFEQIREYFSELEMHQFALIPDKAEEGGLVYKATREMADKQVYGCGCFWFRKT